MKNCIAMFMLLLIGLITTLTARADQSRRVVEISAKRFEFTPNQITLKKGQSVTLRLTSQDVKHGFFVKRLNLDADIVPGKATDVTFTPQTAGKFTSVCDNFCGVGHGDMRMTIVVE